MHRAAELTIVAAVVTTTISSASAQEIPEDFAITLERTICFGTCPAYRVTVDANGRVTYEGEQFVRVVGEQTGRIPRSRVIALAAIVERIRFFELRDQFKTIRDRNGNETYVTDLPTCFVTVTRDGQRKRVEDYIGAPDRLKKLEEQIDAAANTKRWVRIDAATLQQMLREGHFPSGEQQAEMVRSALEHDDVDVMNVLLENGTDPNGAYSHTRPLMMVRSAAMTRLLLDAGANPSMAEDDGSTPLDEAALLAPDVTEMLLKAGVPPDQPGDPDGRTPLWRAACAGNLDVVKLLIVAGADPGIRVNGRSAVECARDEAEMRRQLPAGVLEKPLFVEDSGGVVALLRQAAARKRW